MDGVFRRWEGRNNEYDVADWIRRTTTKLAPDHPAHRHAPRELYQLVADLLELHPGNRPRAHVALQSPFFTMDIPE